MKSDHSRFVRHQDYPVGQAANTQPNLPVAEKKQQDADAARTAADAASAARITAQIKAAAQRLLTIVGAYGATALPRPAGRAQEPKATAKKLFKLTDKDLVGLETKATKARPQTQKMHLPT